MFGHAGADAVAQHRQVPVGHRPEHDEEFLAAPARDVVAGAHHPAQHLRHLLQHPVAGLVAVGVVDVLEMVDVDQREHHHFVGRATTHGFAVVVGDVGGDLVGQVAAVAQAGQRVGLAGFLQPVVGHFQGLGALADQQFQGFALAPVLAQLAPVAGVDDARDQAAEQPVEQRRFVEAGLDAEADLGRRRAPGVGVVRTLGFEDVGARRQVGVVDVAPGRVVERAPVGVVADQAVAQLDALGVLQAEHGELEGQVALGRRQLPVGGGIGRAPLAADLDAFDHRARRRGILDDAAGGHGHHAVAGGQPQFAAFDESLGVAGAVAAITLLAAAAVAAFVEQHFAAHVLAAAGGDVGHVLQQHPVHAADAGHPQVTVVAVGDEKRRVHRHAQAGVEGLPAAVLQQEDFFRQRADKQAAVGQFVDGGHVQVAAQAAVHALRHQLVALQFIQPRLGAHQQPAVAGFVKNARARVAQALGGAEADQAVAGQPEQAGGAGEPQRAALVAQDAVDLGAAHRRQFGRQLQLPAAAQHRDAAAGAYPQRVALGQQGVGVGVGQVGAGDDVFESAVAHHAQAAVGADPQLAFQPARHRPHDAVLKALEVAVAPGPAVPDPGDALPLRAQPEVAFAVLEHRAHGRAHRIVADDLGDPAGAQPHQVVDHADPEVAVAVFVH